jgi:hypothetical protein
LGNPKPFHALADFVHPLPRLVSSRAMARARNTAISLENSLARSSAHMNMNLNYLNLNPGARCLRADRSYFHPA